MIALPRARAATAPSVAASGHRSWRVLVRAGERPRGDRVPRVRTVVAAVLAAAAVVLLGVAGLGLVISRQSAQRESVRQVAELTDVLGESVIQPALTDSMATSTGAASALDGLVRSRVLSTSLVRVKIWSPDGRILYSDEPRLTGHHFGLDADARNALQHPQVQADITDLSQAENRFERGHGTLLEVHRPVWTPAGHPLLFETYFRYGPVTDRAAQLWRGFAGITLSSILAVVVLLTPLVWTLLARTRRAHAQREEGLRRAVDASHAERRRIAAALHDGVVQDLVAASFAVAGGARDVADRGDPATAARLDDAGQAVRAGIAGMRSLLVDIYPPNLHASGLAAALHDLVAGLRADVHVDVDDDAAARLEGAQAEAVFRVAQEALRNAVAHAGAARLHLSLGVDGDAVLLEVGDDGAGLDRGARAGLDRGARAGDHFGLSLMQDAAREAAAELAVASAPGSGTRWRLRVPAGPDTDAAMPA